LTIKIFKRSSGTLVIDGPANQLKDRTFTEAGEYLIGAYPTSNPDKSIAAASITVTT